MDKNLKGLEKEDLIKLVIELMKRIKKIEAELLKTIKRVQVLE